MRGKKRQIKKMIEKAGGKLIGFSRSKKGRKGRRLVWFNEKVSRSTLLLSRHHLTPERVKAEIEETRKRFGIS